MPSNAEVFSMLTIVLIPCLVTAGLLIWHRRKEQAKKNVPVATRYTVGGHDLRKHPNFQAYKQVLEDWNKGVETRIQEQYESQDQQEAA